MIIIITIIIENQNRKFHLEWGDDWEECLKTDMLSCDTEALNEPAYSIQTKSLQKKHRFFCKPKLLILQFYKDPSLNVILQNIV